MDYLSISFPNYHIHLHEGAFEHVTKRSTNLLEYFRHETPKLFEQIELAARSCRWPHNVIFMTGGGESNYTQEIYILVEKSATFGGGSLYPTLNFFWKSPVHFSVSFEFKQRKRSQEDQYLKNDRSSVARRNLMKCPRKKAKKTLKERISMTLRIPLCSHLLILLTVTEN